MEKLTTFQELIPGALQFTIHQKRPFIFNPYGKEEFDA